VRALVEQLLSRIAQLEEQKGRSSRNSSKPPSSDGNGFKPSGEEKRKASGRKRGGQEGHPGASRNLLPSEQCKEVIPHVPTTCRGCGEALCGEDPDPHRHQVVDIPKIAPFVIEHQLHRLICPHCHTSTCAELPVGVESGGFGPQLSALVGLLGGTYHLSHRKVRSLLDQVLGVEISTGSINAIRCRLSESLATLVEEATDAIRQEKVAHLDETGGPIGNADGNNPGKKRGWLWVMVTPALTVFHLALSRSGEMARQVLGEAFAGVVVTDRWGAYNWLPLHRRQICWAHIKRDFTAMAERSGASAQVGQRLLELEKQLFEQWHRWREGQINRQELKTFTTPIRQEIEAWLADTSHPRSLCDCPPQGLGRLWRQLNSREPDFFFPPCYCAAGNAGLKFLLWDGHPIQQGSTRIRHGLLEPPHADFHKAHAPLPVGIHLMAQAFLADGVALQASHQHGNRYH
jgi:hypothetical protein